MKVITIDQKTGKRVYTRTEVARMCDVTTQTIRMWEDINAIPHSERDDESGYRYWDSDAIKEVIKYANMSMRERRGKE